MQSKDDSTKSHLGMRRNRESLIKWYRKIRRDLPWRKDRDPYRIWISEIMLQQTTVAAVVPFYDRFMGRYPQLEDLAAAPIEDVLELWAGLGYYSRARNLHRAAQTLVKAGGFPKSHQLLEELPGFGPYTARAVASLAFDERVGVLDGNVIRILTRHFGLSIEWWKPQARKELQFLADQLAQTATPADLNQGMMELGATICTSTSPACLLCPWAKSCVARQSDQIENLPLKRPRRPREIWYWQPLVQMHNRKVLVIPNNYAPFLKGHWILPGVAKKVAKKPKTFDYKGAVTHHDIFVKVQIIQTHTTKNQLSPPIASGASVSSNAANKKPSAHVNLGKDEKWIHLENLKKEIPSTMIRKAIEQGGI